MFFFRFSLFSNCLVSFFLCLFLILPLLFIIFFLFSLILRFLLCFWFFLNVLFRYRVSVFFRFVQFVFGVFLCFFLISLCFLQFSSVFFSHSFFDREGFAADRRPFEIDSVVLADLVVPLLVWQVFTPPIISLFLYLSYLCFWPWYIGVESIPKEKQYWLSLAWCLIFFKFSSIQIVSCGGNPTWSNTDNCDTSFLSLLKDVSGYFRVLRSKKIYTYIYTDITLPLLGQCVSQKNSSPNPAAMVFWLRRIWGPSTQKDGTKNNPKS